ncbi:EAL domain-containing protein [Rheinheimera sp. UJ63]|uniref:EAL domain-containing protein n=1 Tax=Rheinheimera sp. UJ63 TaxID=2910157 RepID=UPI001F3C7021|nr:EAL domain-containing protein [Rheinheimera sp. UJ63]MCF4011041.1 EAL domain-containing protein [Rheinheimera sp. UJ63]
MKRTFQELKTSNQALQQEVDTLQHAMQQDSAAHISPSTYQAALQLLEKVINELTAQTDLFSLLEQKTNQTMASQKQFNAIFEHAPVGFVILSTDFQIVNANQLARNLLYLPHYTHIKDDEPIKVHAYLAKGVARFIDWLRAASTDSISVELHHPKRQGQVQIYQANFELDGQYYHLLSMVSVAKEHQLTQSLSLFKMVVENLQEAIMITDEHHHIIHVNPAFTAITGYSLDDVFMKNPNILSSGKQSLQFYQDMYAELKEKGQWQGVLYNRTKAGVEFPEELHITSVYSDKAQDKTIKYYIAIFENISEQLAKEKHMQTLAETDVLTGLLNRQGFNQVYHKTFAAAQRDGENLAVLYIDLDKFKYVNDQYGHDYGDELLKSIAKRLQHNIKAKDVAARIGGDEFVVLIQGDNLGKLLKHFGAKLLKLLSAPYRLFEITYTCTASIGIAIYPDDGITESELLKAADAAMYQAKTSGRNKYAFLNKKLLQQQASVSAYLEAILEGIHKDQFQLYYQAQHDMRTGAITGFESLVRWQFAPNDIRTPATFLPQIENEILMLIMGKKLLNQVFSQVNTWQNSGFNWPVSINLSANQLKDDDTYQQIAMLCQQFPNTVPLIHLEVTETTIFEKDEMIFENLERCKRLGLKLVLDDFGTGYSSIYSLKKFQFEVIKIDKSFIDDILHQDAANLVILNGIISLIQALNLAVICEGVENEIQVSYLLNKQCTVAQGFFYNKPMHRNKVFSYILPFLAK